MTADFLKNARGALGHMKLGKDQPHLFEYELLDGPEPPGFFHGPEETERVLKGGNIFIFILDDMSSERGFLF